jgi:hypothetical protein
MAIKDFSNVLYCKTLEASEKADMGTFNLAENLELGHIRTLLFINGAIVGTERARINIYSTSTKESLIAQSSWLNLSDILNLSNYWLGYVRFDFNRQPINNNFTYYAELEIDQYTPSGSFYVGAMHDFPASVYDNAENIFYNHPLVMQIFGYK